MNYRRALSAAALFALSPTLYAQEAKPEEAEAKPPAPASGDAYIAKAGPFEIIRELDATFTSRREHQLSITPKAWADWTLLEVLPHGTKVKKGDRLLRFDTEKLEKAIADTEASEPSAKLALKLAEAELSALEKSTPVQLEAARRAKRIADEDWAYYEKTGHAEDLKAAERSIEFAQRSFDYAREELEQLEKMYAADDLTEETEEIILKRARNDFDRAKESLRLSKMRADREIKVMIPRNRVAKKAAVEAGALSYNTTVQSLPRLLDQKRFEVEKARRGRGDAVQKLRDLKTDLASMEVLAPADGIVFYGRSKDGAWPSAAALAKKLLPGGKISAREVFITVAETSPLGLIAALPEEKIAGLRNGLRGDAAPVSNPALDVPVKVAGIRYVPGNYTAALATEAKLPNIVPGMKAKVKIEVAKFDKAVTVPNDHLDRGHLWVLEAGDKKRRAVESGPSDGKHTVILSGLKDGEKVVKP